MKNPAQKIKATTQKFTEIEYIADDIVFLSFGNACLIIEVTATNFPLLSQDEKNAKIYSYATLLNSLSFPIQIFIQSKKIDISSYLRLLDIESTVTQSQILAGKIKLYRDFVESLVKINSVLDKRFYLIIPYSSMEEGAIKTAVQIKKGLGQRQAHFESATASLRLKADSLRTQLAKLNLHAKTLNKNELIGLFHNLYNEVSPGINNGEQSIQSARFRKKT